MGEIVEAVQQFTRGQFGCPACGNVDVPPSLRDNVSVAASAADDSFTMWRKRPLLPSSLMAIAWGCSTRRNACQAALGAPSESMIPHPAPSHRSRRNQTSAPVQDDRQRRHSL
jgi:hypothetical protein